MCWKTRCIILLIIVWVDQKLFSPDFPNQRFFYLDYNEQQYPEADDASPCRCVNGCHSKHVLREGQVGKNCLNDCQDNNREQYIGIAGEVPLGTHRHEQVAAVE